MIGLLLIFPNEIYYNPFFIGNHRSNYFVHYLSLDKEENFKCLFKLCQNYIFKISNSWFHTKLQSCFYNQSDLSKWSLLTLFKFIALTDSNRYVETY